MRVSGFVLIGLMLAFSSPALAQQPSDADANLFLASEHIALAQRFVPALRAMSAQGKEQTRAFLSMHEVSFGVATQILSNISIAYSTLKFEEFVKNLEGQLDKKDRRYHELVANSRKELDEITARHRRAVRNGRSALQVNMEIVSRDMKAVEEIIAEIREVKVDSLPAQ